MFIKSKRSSTDSFNSDARETLLYSALKFSSVNTFTTGANNPLLPASKIVKSSGEIPNTDCKTELWSVIDPIKFSAFSLKPGSIGFEIALFLNN